MNGWYVTTQQAEIDDGNFLGDANATVDNFGNVGPTLASILCRG